MSTASRLFIIWRACARVPVFSSFLFSNLALGRTCSSYIDYWARNLHTIQLLFISDSVILQTHKKAPKILSSATLFVCDSTTSMPKTLFRLQQQQHQQQWRNCTVNWVEHSHHKSWIQFRLRLPVINVAAFHFCCWFAVPVPAPGTSTSFQPRAYIPYIVFVLPSILWLNPGHL